MLGQTASGGVPRLWFRLRTGTSTTTLTATSGTLPLNTWYHAVATYDGSTMRLYLNGVQVGSAAKAGTLATSASVPVAMGRSPEGSNYLQGALDDVRLYNRALTAGEINFLFSEPPNGPPSIVNPGNLQVQEGAFVLPVVATDPDGDFLTYSAVGALPAGLSINSATGALSGSVVPGSYTITIAVGDGRVQVSTTFGLTVLPTASFTDDPLIPGVTSMKAIHIVELRDLINAFRQLNGLAAFQFTDPVLQAGRLIRAVHIAELRAALDSVYSARGRALPLYSDTTVTAGLTTVRAMHITELRNAVKALGQ
jgi:hypothetical protein